MTENEVKFYSDIIRERTFIMKKFLALALTLIMLASCFSVLAVSVSAEEGDSIVVYDYEASNNGTWKSGGEATDPMDSNTTLIPGKTVLTKTYTKPLHATWGYPSDKTKADFEQISLSYAFPAAVDISAMNYFSFEAYSPDKTLFDDRWILELTSSGKWDVNENTNNGAAINANVTDLGDGWYRVEVEMSVMDKKQNGGGLDKTACNFFRMYYDATETTGGGPFTFDGSYTFGVRNITFSKYKTLPTNEIISVYDYTAAAAENGTWGSGEDRAALDSNTTLIPGQTVLTKTYTKPLHATWGYPADKTKADFEQISLSYAFPAAVDISTMNYFSFEAYSPDKTLFDDRWIFELTSGGKWDVNENTNNGAAINANVTDLGDGWYRVEVEMSVMDKKQNGGGLDKTKCNFFRMYYDATETTGGGPFTFDGSYTFGIRSMFFSKYKMSEANLPDDTPEKVAAIVALFAPIKDIKTGDVTAENYESVKAALAAAEEAYKAAEEAIQERVRAECNVIVIMAAVKQAINAYENPVDDTPADTTPADTTPADTTPETEAPAEEKKGCGSSIGMSAVALVLVCALGVAVCTEKKRVNVK